MFEFDAIILTIVPKNTDTKVTTRFKYYMYISYHTIHDQFQDSGILLISSFGQTLSNMVSELLFGLSKFAVNLHQYICLCSF